MHIRCGDIRATAHSLCSGSSLLQHRSKFKLQGTFADAHSRCRCAFTPRPICSGARSLPHHILAAAHSLQQLIHAKMYSHYGAFVISVHCSSSTQVAPTLSHTGTFIPRRIRCASAMPTSVPNHSRTLIASTPISAHPNRCGRALVPDPICTHAQSCVDPFERSLCTRPFACTAIHAFAHRYMYPFMSTLSHPLPKTLSSACAYSTKPHFHVHAFTFLLICPCAHSMGAVIHVRAYKVDVYLHLRFLRSLRSQLTTTII